MNMSITVEGHIREVGHIAEGHIIEVVHVAEDHIHKVGHTAEGHIVEDVGHTSETVFVSILMEEEGVDHSQQVHNPSS